MRKDFTAISALSAIVAFTAGVVLCMQISQMNPGREAGIAGPVLWVLEIAVFGTAVFAWRPKASFAGWLAGIAMLGVMRVAVVSGSGLLLGMVKETTNMAPLLQQTSALLPRLCAGLFALMVCYPLRVWLPLRDQQLRRREGRRGRGAGAGEEAERGLLIVTVSERGAADSPKGAVKLHGFAGGGHSVPFIEGEVELPLSAVLALLPENLVTDRALALSDTDTMVMPLEVILPQLREAQIVFSVAELRQWIPVSVRKALVQPAESDIETENGLVSLPLELIVPQLPAEALALPSASPPAWTRVEADEHVVFATV